MSTDKQGCPLGHVKIEPACSREVVLTTGLTKRFPTLDDYVAFYVENGYVKDKAELLSSRSRWCTEIMFDWFRRGQLACIFAVNLARVADPPWDSVIEHPPFDDLGERLAVHLDGITKSNGEAAQVVFPSVHTAADAVSLVNALCKSKRWYWDEVPFDDGNQTSLLIGLKWILPSNISVNYVLGFSTLETMPVTRHSPLTTLVLRTSDHKRSEGKSDLGRVQVHLADMDSGLYPQSRHDSVWEATKKAKRLFVEENGPLWAAARARVTFAVPLSLRDHLCPPGGPA
jgi:hypothetical protein